MFSLIDLKFHLYYHSY